MRTLAEIEVDGEKLIAIEYIDGNYGIEVYDEYQVDEFTKDHLPLLKAIIEDMEK